MVTLVLVTASVAPPGLVQGTSEPAGTATCSPESEPNDSPSQASSAAGATCLTGTLLPNDQDLFLWEVAPAGAQSTWSVALDGVPGTRTILDLRLVTSEPGMEPLAVGGPLLALTVDTPASEPAVRDEVLMPPGRYLVSVSAGGQAGGAADAAPALGTPALSTGTELPTEGGTPGTPGTEQTYTVTLTPGDALPPNRDVEPNDDTATATGVSEAFAISGDLSGSADTYRWTVTPDAASAWDLSATLPLGSGGTLTMATADGGTTLVRAQPTDGWVELPDLVLAPGDYLVTMGPAAATPTPYLLSATAIDGPAGDPEPNDTQTQAVAMPSGQPLARGRLARAQDDDWYRFEIDEGLAAETVDIRMIWRSGLRRELCLYGSGTAALLCRDATDGLDVSGLSLPVGSYTLRVRGDADPDDVYLIRIDTAGPPGANVEREPDDTPDTATALPAGTTMRGRARGLDIDHFRLDITGEPQLWRIDVQGKGIETLEWIRPDGERLGDATLSDDGTGGTLTDMYLTPGEQWFRVTADDGDYQVSTTPLGPPDPAAEREPNDLPAREEWLAVGRPRVGRMPTPTDVDIYRFSVRGTDHLSLTIEPPGDGSLQALVQDAIGLSRRLQAEGGEPIHDDLLLGPGDYRVVLSPVVPSQERYSIGLERLDPFRLTDDQEPNDQAREARSFPPSGTVQGTAATSADTDWYVLPQLEDGIPVTIVADGGITAMALSDGVSEQTLFAQSDGLTYQGTPMAPGATTLLRVSASGPYTLSLATADLARAGVEPVAHLEAALVLDSDTVAAWWQTGQRVTGMLGLANLGDSDQQVRLDALASDRSWRLGVPPGPIVVPAAGNVDVPIEVLMPPDVPGGEPVRLTIRATTADGAEVTAGVDIVPSSDALPEEEALVWPIPDELLGGLDVASLALGATPIPSLEPIGEERLHDGVVATDWGLAYPIGVLPVTLTMDLAGDEPVPVAGTVIQPFSEDPTLGDSARDFELALSLDGTTWQTVLSGTLDPVSAEQSFVLDQPVKARLAQLRVISGQREQPSRLDLGEWKVVASPDWSPAGPLDLADPRAGGHIVRMAPQPFSSAQATSVLEADRTAQPLGVETGSNLEWVVGFMDDRAALVSGLTWQDPLPSDPTTRLRRVVVSASSDSPLGPWLELGTWTLERGADGSVSPFELAQPAWARFLRLTGSAGKKKAQVELPARIGVLEVPQSESYRSILGQWGMGSPAGPLEWRSGPPVLERDDEPTSPDDASHARDLAEGEEATGRVHYGEDADWYRVTIPSGQHSLSMTVGGPRSVGAALALRTPDGVEVPMSFGPGEEPGTVTYLAAVEPGASYLVEVSQPRSSIVVSFDSSASVSTQLAAIESGLRTLAAGMADEREALRIVPFDNRPLLPTWSSDPYEIADAVNRFRLDESSSAVESNLREATLDLLAREGARAILLITDAASSSFDDTERLWSSLSVARPEVFTVAIGGEGEVPAIERHHRMADWAASAGGVASQARGGVEVLQAFERLAATLRRPAAYRLDYQTAADELPLPPPGHISVLAPEVDGRRPAVLGSGGVIELVVDVSGSMRKRLGNMSRLAVAKQVLTELVRNDLPVGVPVALRAFPSPSDNCGGQLLMPLGPLDPRAATSTIAELAAARKAATPLARAISTVADDLGEVGGPRIVVILSDGTETCKGDPATAVRRLRAQGFDVTLNVVGLTLDKTSRDSISRLAQLGGGSYFDAADPESLGAALRAAVSAPFEIRDGSGAVVGRGAVGGGPVEVAPGRYEVSVLTDPAVAFGAVFLEPDTDITLTLPQP